MKKNLRLLLIVALLCLICTREMTAYGGFFDFLNREPEFQNRYGRMWYQVIGCGANANCYLESYYSYGASVQITFNNVVKVNGTAHAKELKYIHHESEKTNTHAFIYTVTNEGYGKKDVTYINTNFYGAAYGITVNKSIKGY